MSSYHMIVGCCCRCDLVRLVSEALMAKQGYGSDEKHFPSRVSLQLTPMAQPDILSLSVSRSTDNPVLEVGGLDASPGVMPAPIGIGVSAHEAVTPMPWKFEHAVHGNTHGRRTQCGPVLLGQYLGPAQEG
jgi:hypothetical protein